MLGETLQKAREAKGVTTSEAAAATRMKIQHVEALEREDFSKVAAAAYAKGFIRLYSDYLGLDPDPLVDEYVEKYMPRERQPILPEDEEGSNASDGGEGGFSLDALRNIEWPFTFSKRLVGGVLGALACLIVLIVLLSMLSKGREDADQEVVSVEPEEVEAVVAVQRSASSPVLIQGPPDPFIDLYEKR